MKILFLLLIPALAFCDKPDSVQFYTKGGQHTKTEHYENSLLNRTSYYTNGLWDSTSYSEAGKTVFRIKYSKPKEEYETVWTLPNWNPYHNYKYKNGDTIRTQDGRAATFETSNGNDMYTWEYHFEQIKIDSTLKPTDTIPIISLEEPMSSTTKSFMVIDRTSGLIISKIKKENQINQFYRLMDSLWNENE